MPSNRKVLIIQEVMKHYRLPFYEELYRLLKLKNIELTVAYSLPEDKDIDKSDNVILPENYGKIVTRSSTLKNKLVFQHCLGDIKNSDLVIVEQANKHLLNYLLIILSFFKAKRFAFWGHGKNFQAENFNVKERIKKWLIPRADWWFAYTAECAEYINNSGVAKANITNVENSIDVTSFKNTIEKISLSEISDFKNKLQIPETAIIGLYCGAIYSEKQIAFLNDCLPKIKAQVPDLYVIFAGAGPDQKLVEGFCQEHDWSTYLGPIFGKEKALCFSISSIILNPGLVGLGVLDGFAAGKAIITTNYPQHSPEAAYIINKQNGIISSFNQKAYIEAVVSIISDPTTLKFISENAKLSASHYSIENMAYNFAEGISQALEQ